MSTGLIVVVLVLVAASAFGLWRKRTDGTVKVRGAQGQNTSDSQINSADFLSSDQLGQQLGARATLVQFSTVFCQPCRATKVILADVAAQVDGVAHVELDAESHLDLVREIGIMRTPTTLILDREGRITGRASGVPRKAQVLAAIGVSVR
jgi:thiol-disulfide isomerase/thioredoxin